jgi:hypothetical protein
MTTPQDVLKIARSYIGVKESPSNSNRQIFGEWYGWNGVPWCAIFVSFCLYKAKMSLAEIPPTNTKGFAYCPYGVDYFKKQGKLDKNPKVRDIVFFDWQKDGVSDHVGIVEKVVSPSKVVCIEGNTSYGDNSNGGQVMRRTRELSSILGFAHPDYNGIVTTNGDEAPTWSGQYIKLTSPMQRGNDIREWQEQMIENGYNLGVDGADGVFGPLSHEALIKFQKDRDLEVDGVIGSITWDETWRQA